MVHYLRLYIIGSLFLLFATASAYACPALDQIKSFFGANFNGNEATYCQNIKTLQSLPDQQQRLQFAEKFHLPISSIAGKSVGDKYTIVFRDNGRNQMVPAIASKTDWAVVGSNGRRRFVNRSLVAHKYLNGTDSLQWDKKGLLFYCPNGDTSKCYKPKTPGTKEVVRCEHEKYLSGTGLTFDQVRKSGNVDCKSSIAKKSDFLALACNLYFEGRGEGSLGRDTIAEVTLNRTIANIGRKNSFGTVAKTVYRSCHFSWTCQGDAMVRFSKNPMDVDRTAWHDSLAQAVEYLSYNENGQSLKPMITNPTLTCYNYYLSLDFYKTRSDLTNWAKIYYDATKDGARSQKPICVGRHIFFRDPKDPCDTSARNRNPEMDTTAIRTSFYKGCLKAEPEMSLPGPRQPTDNNICPDNMTFQQAVSGQYDDYDIQGNGTIPIEQVPANINQ